MATNVYRREAAKFLASATIADIPGVLREASVRLLELRSAVALSKGADGKGLLAEMAQGELELDGLAARLECFV